MRHSEVSLSGLSATDQGLLSDHMEEEEEEQALIDIGFEFISVFLVQHE